MRAPDPNCGPKALAAIIKDMGMQSAVAALFGSKSLSGSDDLAQRLIDLCKADPKDGSSLADLKDTAAQIGLHTKGYRLDLDMLKSILTASPRPPVSASGVVVWVNRNHYIAVLGMDGSLVKIYDPAGIFNTKNNSRDTKRRSGLIGLDAFEKMWDGYTLVVWKHGDKDPVATARERTETRAKIARNIRNAGGGCLVVLACLISLCAFGSPVSFLACVSSKRTLRIRRRSRRRLSRLFTKFSAVSLLCTFLLQPAFAVTNQQSTITSRQFVPEYPVVRALTDVEMEQIHGTQGAAPAWQSSSQLVSCASCGGGTTANLSSSANGSGGNVFGLTKLIQGGGQKHEFSDHEHDRSPEPRTHMDISADE